MKSIEKIANSANETFDKETITLVSEMKENEAKLTDMQNYLTELKNNELSRINFEFLRRDYQRRFNINHEEIVSIIVGEDSITDEVSKLRREQKVKY